jgi:hypothetical protein
MFSSAHRQWVFGVFVFGWFFFAGGAVTHGGVVTFLNDYEGFLAAAGEVQVIDFNTLPDGSPTQGGELLSPTFNYTDWGATFSAPAGVARISEGPVSGFWLVADNYPESGPMWITADLTTPAYSVGVYFGYFMELRAYDALANLIATASLSETGWPNFLGIVSDEPIYRVIADRHDWYYSAIETFAFTPVPEPATIFLLTLGAVALVRRRVRNA